MNSPCGVHTGTADLMAARQLLAYVTSEHAVQTSTSTTGRPSIDYGFWQLLASFQIALLPACSILRRKGVVALNIYRCWLPVAFVSG